MATSAQEMNKHGEGMLSPFLNDPFAMIWMVFKDLYPGKRCEVWYGHHQKDDSESGYGYTDFPKDGGVPVITIFDEYDSNIQAETLAHELAHVAVGIEHEHDSVWEAAFEAISDGYRRLGDELFGAATDDDR